MDFKSESQLTTMNTKKTLLLPILAASFAVITTSQAAVILGTSVTSDLTPDNDAASLSSLVDGTIAGDTAGHDDNQNIGWNNYVDPTLTIDLGGTYDLNSASVWNLAHFTPGIDLPDTITIAISNDSGVSYGATTSFTIPTVGAIGQYKSTADLSSAVNRLGATHVQIQMVNDDNGLNRSWVFASDVQINAVPEPSSTALLGLGGIALILRRRK